MIFLKLKNDLHREELKFDPMKKPAYADELADLLNQSFCTHQLKFQSMTRSSY